MNEKVNFSMGLNFNAENEGVFEGILVNYNHENLAHGIFKFAKGSMSKNSGKPLFVLYNHESGNIPVGTMTGTDTDEGFKIVAKLDMSKDEGGYINKNAAALYNLMKNGAQFELSVGGWLKEYAEKKENGEKFIEITEFDAYEGSITPRGAVEGSRITNVFSNFFNNEGGNMTKEEMQALLQQGLQEFAKNMVNAQKAEEIEALPKQFKELQEQFDKMRGEFSKEVLEGFENKFSEINEVIKSLRKDFKATAEEISDAEQFTALLRAMEDKGTGVTQEFTATSEIAFGEIGTTDGTGSNVNLDKTIKPTYVTRILERLQARNPVLADINFISITDGSLYIPREMIGLPEAGWVGEVANRDETAITKIDNVTITLFQLYAMPVVSNKLLATNFVGYANFLLRRVEYVLSLKLANAILNGDGTLKPKGVLQETAITGAKKTLDNSADDKLVDSIIDAYYSVREEIASGAKWYMRRETWARIAKLKNAQKDFYITDLNTGNTRTLMTRPVVIVEDDDSGLKAIDTATADTDPVILFANLGMAVQGVVNNRLDLRIEDRITQKGVTKYYMEKLVGAGVQLPEYALMLVKKL